MNNLYIYNSLKRSKEIFIPKNKNKIIWYQCGPTVYSDSHIGHARTYISLDIIHRIMKNYLGYNLIICQNITDIDDKIIIKSNNEGISFKELSSKYEQDFFSDMNKLGVSYPDIITRVSEYVPEIINYIESLVDRGFAYLIEGSVYFDISRYTEKGFIYGKLAPEQVGNIELLREGEGSLFSENVKRSEKDFVLWKKTKDEVNEPYWESPWGKGRPGWHIECSVMSYYAFKNMDIDYLDVHAGGVDLKFPHHENEEAQSSAYLNCNTWTKYWLHTGHLNIKGKKMSKSLKNFITIRESLQKYTPRQIRFCFLLHKYNTTMDYSEDTMTNAINIENIFNTMFQNVKIIMREYPNASGKQYLENKEHELLNFLELTKSNIKESILDDFDTPRSINHLLDLVKKIYKYIDSPPFSTIILYSVVKYISYILRVFGLMFDDIDIGFFISNLTDNKEEILRPLIETIINIRNKVRESCKVKDISSLLNEMDKLRDETLPELGILIEDRENKSVWKLEDPDKIKLDRFNKEKQELEKKKIKEEKHQMLLREKEKKEELKNIPPELLFRRFSDIYSIFDEEHIPTHDKDGNPISKNLYKKLKKEMNKHKQLYRNR